jgi:ankyrin repeat protein
MVAARRGLEPIVSLLLDAGADLHSQKGVTGNALKGAAHGGHELICRLLLDRGADVNSLGGEYG